MKGLDSRTILALKFYSEDLHKKVTVRRFLTELLTRLWEEKDRFSGKRPFGNSGWDHDIQACLVKNFIVNGRLDENGYLIELDEDKADKVIKGLIRAM